MPFFKGGLVEGCQVGTLNKTALKTLEINVSFQVNCIFTINRYYYVHYVQQAVSLMYSTLYLKWTTKGVGNFKLSFQFSNNKRKCSCNQFWEPKGAFKLRPLNCMTTQQKHVRGVQIQVDNKHGNFRIMFSEKKINDKSEERCCCGRAYEIEMVCTIERNFCTIQLP